jgi:hypothetical protein
MAALSLPASPHALQRHRRAIVTVPHLSFATDLLFNLDDVRNACTRGLATQSNLVALLKSRIALERQYASELSRMTQQSQLDELESGTMREALGKLKAQYLNTSVQHRTLANNLEEDVLRPIEALYTYNAQKASNLTKLVNNIKKQAKVHEDAYKKDYQAFDKQFRDATTQFAAAMDAGFSSTEIEHQYLVQLAQIDNGFDDDERMEMMLDMGSTLAPDESRPRQKSAAAMQTLNNNSNKLVHWLLASDQQRKENVYTKAVQVLEVSRVYRLIRVERNGGLMSVWVDRQRKSLDASVCSRGRLSSRVAWICTERCNRC